MQSKKTRLSQKTKHATSLALYALTKQPNNKNTHQHPPNNFHPRCAHARTCPRMTRASACACTRTYAGTQARTQARITHVCASTHTRMRTHAYEKKKKIRARTSVTHVCASTRTHAHARVHTRKKSDTHASASYTCTCTRIAKIKKLHTRALSRARVRKKTGKIFTHVRALARARMKKNQRNIFHQRVCTHVCACVRVCVRV